MEIHIWKEKLSQLWWRRGAAAAAKSLQLRPTLCDPIDGSPPGSAVPRILQVRTLEWVAISFSNAWKRKVKVKSLSSVWLLVTPWTAAYQAPLSMGLSRQENWSGLPLPSAYTENVDTEFWNSMLAKNSTWRTWQSTYWVQHQKWDNYMLSEIFHDM